MALSPERQSARMSEIKNGRLGLYGAEDSKCKHLTTLGFKALIPELQCYSISTAIAIELIMTEQ